MIVKRKLIGEIFPVANVSRESVREKSIRYGHISTFHPWWARRPLAASRATIYASLVDPPVKIDEWGIKSKMVSDLSKWESSTNKDLLQKARDEIIRDNNGQRPRVLDPFGGGGSIPLESMRLGCETHSSDINPVSLIVQKCTLEYPQKFGQTKSNKGLASKETKNKLLDDILKWSNYVFDESYKDLGEFYPKIDGALVIGWITARTITCQNHKCSTEIPLMNYFWLSKRANRNIAVCPRINGKKIQFKIVGDGYDEIPKEFNPNKGTVSRARAICLACGTVIDPKSLKKILHEKKSWDKRIAFILDKKGISGKIYRIVDDHDLDVFEKAKKFSVVKKKQLTKKMSIDPVPDEIISTPDNKEYKPGGVYFLPTAGAVLYGMTRWKDLFNTRQLISIMVFCEKIKVAYQKMCDEYGSEYSKVITTYLAVMLNKLACKNTKLSRYHVARETIEQIFGRQAITVTWYYAELNPFATNGWKNIQDYVLRVIKHCSDINQPPANIIHESATNLSSHPDEFFDAVFTDPPYYDNVPYSIISDFFYVWMKRSIGDLYPELFFYPLTPKSDEIIASVPIILGMNKKIATENLKTVKSRDSFESLLLKSFKEIYRVLKKNGIAVIVYAHKSTDGWTTLINSMLESNLVITAAWPVNTEMKSRLMARESATLSSSIYMVARKIDKENIGSYHKIKNEIKVSVIKKLEHLWNQGILGADFFISAIGASIEVFGKYNKVIDDADNVISASQLLEDIRGIVTDFAIRRVLQNGISGEISKMTRFYVLWRWAYGYAKMPFDDARKLAHGMGINIQSAYARGGVIKKEQGSIRVLDPMERSFSDGSPTELIDVLHSAVIMWKGRKYEQMRIMLKESGFGGSDVLYRVAQAIAESNRDSPESKLLQAFLASKNKIIGSMREDSVQTKLDP